MVAEITWHNLNLETVFFSFLTAKLRDSSLQKLDYDMTQEIDKVALLEDLVMYLKMHDRLHILDRKLLWGWDEGSPSFWPRAQSTFSPQGLKVL